MIVRRLALLGSLSLLAIAPKAHAWGGYGHAIIADIAMDRLDPTAAAAVKGLLQLDGEHSLDEVASWPDTIGHVPPAQGGLPQTLPWHYVDIDVANATYDAARDCPDGHCVTAKLPEMIATLADAHESALKRLAALKWVVHLVGDIHQPLHASERNDDKGGNLVKIAYFGDDHNGHQNLHSLWDEGIIDREDALVVGPHYSIDRNAARKVATVLNAQITAGQAAFWAQGLQAGAAQAVQGWTNESHALSISIAYGALPKGEHPDLGAAYTAIAWPVIQVRLEQAGVRLAAVLNQALGERP